MLISLIIYWPADQRRGLCY